MSEHEKLIGSENTKMNLSKNGITRPSIELDDFYSLLDRKVVDKIKSTPKESLKRIADDVSNYEYNIDGAKNILDSLK